MTTEPFGVPKSISLNDNSDYGLCFACGPKNKEGLQLTFERHGDRVVTTYQGKETHQGFPGFLHGAVIAALVDEVMSRVPVLENRWGMSARLDIRFRLPIGMNEAVTAQATKSGRRGNIITTKAWVTLGDNRVAVEATGSYALLSEESLDQMALAYPGLAASWKTGENPSSKAS